MTDDGILIEGDNLKNLSIIGLNDEGSCETIISSNMESVLISEDNGEITVLEDANGDGIYEKDISEDKPSGKPIDLSTCKLALLESEYTYDGTEKKPEITITNDDKALIKETDYTVTYSDNINAGTASVTVKGQGDYTGSITETFTINKADQEIEAVISSANIIEGEQATIEVSAKAGVLSYSSSDTDVATVDDNGVVTAVSAGTATIAIIASETENYNSAKTTIEVIVTTKAQPHTHVYGQPKFNWPEDNQICTATFTCEADDDTQTVDCTVTDKEIPATCTGDGKIVYTATVEFEGKTYTDTKEVVGDSATGHNYEYIDNEDGTHTAVCKECDNSVKEPHNYVDGVCICGSKKSVEEHTHTYGKPIFKWSNNNRDCTATFTCEKDDDVHTVDCTVTSETTPATEKEDGQIVYTATVEFNDKIYTDIKTSVIPATGSVDSDFTFGNKLKNWFKKWFGGNNKPSEPDTPDTPTKPEEPSVPETPITPDKPSDSGFNLWNWITRWWKK